MTRVFRFLENEGALFNIIGKKEIMSELGIRPVAGKPSSKNIPSKHLRRQGGRPSAYKITETFGKIRQVMEKQEAQSLLGQRLLSTSLTYNYERFCLLAIAHCARMDFTVAENLISMAARPEQLPHISEYRPYLQYIASLDDTQLEIFVDRYYRWMAETKPYDIYFLLSFPMLEWT
jgi:hypothetical protein